jgi:hypothetical protein|nr:hypothetical protein [Akkermansia muciniphila]
MIAVFLFFKIDVFTVKQYQFPTDIPVDARRSIKESDLNVSQLSRMVSKVSGAGKNAHHDQTPFEEVQLPA